MDSSMGERIRQLRTEKGLSQAELAQVVHVDSSYIGLLETGRRKPSDAIVKRLAQALGTTPTALYEAAGVVQLSELDEEQFQRTVRARSIDELLTIKYELEGANYLAQIVEMVVEREQEFATKDSKQKTSRRRRSVSNQEITEDADWDQARRADSKAD